MAKRFNRRSRTEQEEEENFELLTVFLLSLRDELSRTSSYDDISSLHLNSSTFFFFAFLGDC